MLCPGGVALVYAWALEQNGGRSGHAFAAQDVFVPFHKRGATASAQGEGSDSQSAAVVHQRYCHVYRKGELRELAESIPGARVLQEYYDTGNHCIVVQKEGAVASSSSQAACK